MLSVSGIMARASLRIRLWALATLLTAVLPLGLGHVHSETEGAAASSIQLERAESTHCDDESLSPDSGSCAFCRVAPKHLAPPAPPGLDDAERAHARCRVPRSSAPHTLALFDLGPARAPPIHSLV